MPDRALARALTTDLSRTDVNVVLVSSPRDDEELQFARIGMHNHLGERFRMVAQRALAEISKLQANGDLELVAYDAGHKPDSHQLAWIVANEAQPVVDHLGALPSPGDAPEFDGNEGFVSGLHHYAIILEGGAQGTLQFLRKCSPKIQLSRSRFVAALFANGTYSKADDRTLLFDDKADCIIAGGRVFIRNVHNFQTIFKYHADLERVARESLETIKTAVQIRNFEVFAVSCMTHVNKLAKLRNIATKPYLQHVTMKDIKRTIKQFNLTSVRVVKRDGEEVLEYDEVDQWVVLKLLDDDYLGSVMTKHKYIVNSKHLLGA